MVNIKQEETGVKHINKKSPSRKGDMAEFYAVTWLWDNGYEVFKNCGCDGMIDFIVRDPEGNITLVDVKTFGEDTRWKNPSWSLIGKRTDQQKEAGVQFLGFRPDNRKLRWVNHEK